MKDVAIIHLCILIIAFPLGLTLIRRFVNSGIHVVGWSILLLWGLAVLLLTDIWPFDFILSPIGSVVTINNINDHIVEIEEWPGSYFYDSWIHITRPDGSIACIPIDFKDCKWWLISVKQNENEIVIGRWLGLDPLVVISKDFDKLFLPRRNNALYNPNSLTYGKHKRCGSDSLRND